MGVPALFRWLSKKYPKIVLPVVEEDETSVTTEDGTVQTIPVDASRPNPNGKEFDNLYLDYNGIVHACTHPEGKPAPPTEQDMMLEIFSYTDRIFDMVRPRKLLFIAIDGVAPRAKMNQQRSRRFRAAQDAAIAAKELEESIILWESMGKDYTPGPAPWDSNAITPGTPFMDLLSTSVKWWITKKLNTDPAWKDVQVIFSDASVPGEGEHKIMDWIRRQRSNANYNPNTAHVIYGLDADLIILSLATHEPHFRVLREDVFAQDSSSNACRKCGEDGHYAAQCTAALNGPIVKPKPTGPPAKKPFIFLDVPTLREYLEIELNLPYLPFPFDVERAIDDWVLLIFFVGNDFLPHLPSLEIREGAIDTLLKIWKDELPRMGGYLTNNGRLELARVELMFHGLASREDDIFRRRREDEERRDQNAKRRKLDDEARTRASVPAGRDTQPNGAGTTVNQNPYLDQATKALAGSNSDVVANRAAIRLANLSAADAMRAELMRSKNGDDDATSSSAPAAAPQFFAPGAFAQPVTPSTEQPTPQGATPLYTPPSLDIPLPTAPSTSDDIAPVESSPAVQTSNSSADVDGDTLMADGVAAPANGAEPTEEVPHGVKRTHDEMEKEQGEDQPEAEEDEAAAPVPDSTARVVRPDGTVEQDDKVRLWEPGYKERYYQDKFQQAHSDTEFRKELAKHYVQGIAWVLLYYYQGTPSWKWFYPYHFAPFAGDFEDVKSMGDVYNFKAGEPFKPFEQLMGVFPSRSRSHIPKVFHHLMLEADSPIIDFYPEEFQIDMNGKKMAWQGVALLPFIEEERLLGAMKPHYSQITEAETIRNKWGTNVLFLGEQHKLFDSLCLLYTKRQKQEKKMLLPIDTRLSGGFSGSVCPDPTCIPGATYPAPFDLLGVSDVFDNRAISVVYYYPKQETPHRSVLLPGANRPPRVLGQADAEYVRNGGGNRGRGRHHSGRGRDGNYSSIGGYTPHGGTDDMSQMRGSPSWGGGGGRGGYGQGRGGGRSPPDNFGYGGGSYTGGSGYGGGGYGAQGGPGYGNYGGPYGGGQAGGRGSAHGGFGHLHGSARGASPQQFGTPHRGRGRGR